MFKTLVNLFCGSCTSQPQYEISGSTVKKVDEPEPKTEKELLEDELLKRVVDTITFETEFTQSPPEYTRPYDPLVKEYRWKTRDDVSIRVIFISVHDFGSRYEQLTEFYIDGEPKITLNSGCSPLRYKIEGVFKYKLEQREIAILKQKLLKLG